MDYEDAMTRCLALDSQLTDAASAISSNYSDLVTLAARQTFGGIDITISNGTDGQWNSSDVMIFMKNLGGLSGRVNPVEVLYAAFPMFLYFNASFGGALLAPLLEFQDSPLYTLPYAASDLGQNYPVASGDSATSNQGVEQSGNMLIMALAHARASGDGSLINQHYDLLKNWTTYLLQNSETPTHQESADDENAANMTNLAIKGIIGIKAMSEISLALDKTDDASQFSSIAAAYVNAWQSLSLSSNSTQKGLLFAYGDEGTWALIYNLYADRLLQTGLIDESIYDVQADYYSELANKGLGPFGLPLDSTSLGHANSAWLAFTAASVSNTTVRDTLLNMAWSHAARNITPGAFPTEYSATTGLALSGYASPAQGAMFAPLALSIANQSIRIPAIPAIPSSVTPRAHKAIGVIIGGVLGGVAALVLISLSVCFLWRRKRKVSGRGEFDELRETSEGLLPMEPFQYRIPQDSLSRIGPVDPQNTQENAVLPSKLSRLERRTHEVSPLPPGLASTAPASSREPSSTAGELLHPDITGLRTEMENLRRVVQELQFEPLPPSYS